MKRFVVFILIGCFLASSPVWGLDTVYSGNYVIPETQSGFMEEQYESKAAQKLQRGAENFLLGPLEVPHTIKKQVAKRRSEYLPVGIETYTLGIVRGVGNGLKRSAVGLFEMFTFPFPQEPIVKELDEWLY